MIMKKVQTTIGVVTLYLLIFQSALLLRISPDIIASMFIMAPFLVISMVYIVLKFGSPSKYTFDQRFYEDLDYERNGKEELDNNY
jgi:hypothetical protein